MMAHIWERTGDDVWKAVPLDGEAVVFGKKAESSATPGQAATADCRDARAGRVRLVRRRDADRDTWMLISERDSAVRINGRALHVGLHVLRDKDEFCLTDGASRFFSTERLARIEVRGSGTSAICPRCKQPIEEGIPAVRCPGCGVVHHQCEELPCWTGYLDTPFATCAMCDQIATLGADFQWSPEGL